MPVPAPHTVCAIVPTYNNAGTLGAVLSAVRRQVAMVYVVDDGCTDATPQVIADVCGADAATREARGFRLLRHAANRGKGAALRTALREARAAGFRYAVTIDADGQHPADAIPRLLAPLAAHPDALVTGARSFTHDRINGQSTFANRFSNFWYAVETLTLQPDTQCGMRVYPLRRLGTLLGVTDRYEAELALMVFAAWRGVEVVAVPIDAYYPPPEERVSWFRPARDFARISVLNTVLCLLAAVYGWPRTLFRRLLRLGRSLWAGLAFVLGIFLVLWPVTLLARLCLKGERRRYTVRRALSAVSRFAAHHVPGTSFRVTNAWGTDLSRPAVLVSNHLSVLDLVCILSLSPHIVVVAKDWAWRSPFFGYIIRQAGFLPVADGIEQSMPRLRQRVEAGCSILIFPEGTRSVSGRTGRFHLGAFYTAQQLQLPLVPLHLAGTGHVLPPHRLLLRPAPRTLAVGRALTPPAPDDSHAVRRLRHWLHRWYVAKEDGEAQP